MHNVVLCALYEGHMRGLLAKVHLALHKPFATHALEQKQPLYVRKQGSE